MKFQGKNFDEVLQEFKEADIGGEISPICHQRYKFMGYWLIENQELMTDSDFRVVASKMIMMMR